MGRKRSGGHAGNAGDARQPRYGRVKRCRRLLAPGTGGDARRPVATGDARFYRQNAPLQQALFNISATEKAATPVIPPADDNAFNGSLSDETAVMAWLKKRIAVQLRLSDPASLHPNQDLLQLGMDSLLFLELSSDIQHYLGVRINAERAWQDLSPHGLTQLICSKPEATPAASQPEVLRHDADERYAPFPLTPIQHAYWLGRTHLIGYGGVACHVLFEWDKRHDEFNLAILEKAWNQLIARHDMLRMVVDADGQQRILATTPEYHIPRDDLRALSRKNSASRWKTAA